MYFSTWVCLTLLSALFGGGSLGKMGFVPFPDVSSELPPWSPIAINVAEYRALCLRYSSYLPNDLPMIPVNTAYIRLLCTFSPLNEVSYELGLFQSLQNGGDTLQGLTYQAKIVIYIYIYNWEVTYSDGSWDTYVAWDGTVKLCAFNVGMLPCSGGLTRLGHFRLRERSWHTAAVNDRGDRLTQHVD